MEKEESKEKTAPSELDNLTDAETSKLLERYILNSTLNKYDVILLARRWAYELKSKEHETRSIQELIPQAISDVLGNKVSFKMIRELPTLKLQSAKKAKPTPHSLLDHIGKVTEEPEDEEPVKKSKKKS